MGGEESKPAVSGIYSEAVASFSEEERVQLHNVFLQICADSSVKTSFGLNQFNSFTNSSLSKNMQREIFDHLCKSSKLVEKKAEDSVTTEKGFLVGMSAFLKGSVSEKAELFFNFCGGHGSVTIEHDQIIAGLKDLMNCYILVETNTPEFSTWRFTVTETSELCLSEFLIKDIKPLENGKYDLSAIEKWFGTADLVLTMLDAVLHSTFSFFFFEEEMNLRSFRTPTIPNRLSVGKDKTPAETILRLPHILFLNNNIPLEMRRQWRLLFSSVNHGESFSKLIEHVDAQGPCIVVVRDKDQHLFGGFASQGFQAGPKFTGNERSFVYTIKPAIEIHFATGYNASYCYLNWRQKTMPNGLGFGGMSDQNVRDFGLWIDSSFQNGMSKYPCTTFNSPMLSGKTDFQVDAIEIWGVGPRKSQATESRTSALDADPEAKAMLEMLGKTQHSDGLRESDATAESPSHEQVPFAPQ